MGRRGKQFAAPGVWIPTERDLKDYFIAQRTVIPVQLVYFSTLTNTYKDAEAICRLFPFPKKARQCVILRKHLSSQWISWIGTLDKQKTWAVASHLLCCRPLVVFVIIKKKNRNENDVSSNVASITKKTTLEQILHGGTDGQKILYY